MMQLAGSPSRSLLLRGGSGSAPARGCRRGRGAPAVTRAEHLVRVCTNKDCRRKGANATLKLMEGLAPGSVTVEEVDCLSECGIGPNVEVVPEGEMEPGKVLNGIKSAKDVALLLEGQLNLSGIAEALESE